DFLLGLIEKQPDLTLDEVVLAMRKHKIAGSRTAVWRFFKRHKITFKKKPAPCAAGALEDHHLCGRASPQWHESAVHCWFNEWSQVSGLRRTVSGPDPQAQGYRHDRQSSCAQSCWHTRSD